MNKERMLLKLQLLMEAIEEMDKMEIEENDEVIEESAKWKEYYDKISDVRVPKGTSKQYGEFAASYGGGDNMRHLKNGGKAIADDSRRRMESEREDAYNMSRFKKADAKSANYFDDTVSKMIKSKQVHDKINKRVNDKINGYDSIKKAMGESVEEHLNYVDNLLETLTEDATSTKNNANYKSMKINLWSKDFDLKIRFDKFKGEEVTEDQFKAIDELRQNAKKISDDSLKKIKDFCMKNYSDIVTDDFENIFKYVSPNLIYVKRSNKKLCGIMCNFKCDPEHGLVICVENGRVTKVGPQDIII